MAAHRYWRLYVNTTNGDAYARIGELQFRTSSGGPNLCTGGTPSKTGEFVPTGDNSALAGFDGNSATAWASNDGLGRGLGYDIVTPADVQHVTIIARNDGFGPAGAPQSADLRYSDDNITFTTYWSIAGQTGWAAGETRTFAIPVVPTTLAVTGGGGSVALVGTVSETGAVAETAGGASVAAAGTLSMVGVMSIAAGGASVSGLAGEVTDNPYRLGMREIQADFNGVRSSNISITKRPDAVSWDYLRAFSMGPSALGVIADGVIARAWYVRVDNGSQVVYIAKANDLGTGWNAETVLFVFSGADIEEVDLAFDQSGNTVVCAERKSGALSAKEVWLYWFKPALGAFTFEMKDAGRTPRILLDNPPDTANSDVILFYLKTGVGVVYRVQRELYATVHATPHVNEPDWYIEDAYYTIGWRVAVFLVKHNVGGAYGKKRLETALMPVYLRGLESPIQLSASFADSILRVVLFIFTDDTGAYPVPSGPSLKEFIELSSEFGLGSTLREVLLFNTLFDPDDVSLSADFPSGLSTLVDSGGTLFTSSLYDPEQITISSDFGAANSLAAVLIDHALYDKDGATLSTSFGTGGTLA